MAFKENHSSINFYVFVHTWGNLLKSIELQNSGISSIVKPVNAKNITI